MELCKQQLSYCRSIYPGKAVFYYKTPEKDFIPLEVEKTKILGMKSGYSEAYQKDGEPKPKEPKDLAYGNPQTIEACYVPPNVDSIFCKFSLRVEANSLLPDRCDDPDVVEVMRSLVSLYSKLGGFKELADRYCRNLLSGNWLWRNRNNLGTRITVNTSTGLSIEISDGRFLTWHAHWPEEDEKALIKLVDEFHIALTEKDKFWFAEVEAEMKTGFCQEVFPSQSFVEKEENESSKTLATVVTENGVEAAVLTPQKIGAAIHVIDDWWSEGDDQPLRVHEYGADRHFLAAYRHPEKQNDFYTLLKRSDEFIDVLQSIGSKNQIPSEVHYLVAVLIKGGLFQRGKTQ